MVRRPIGRSTVGCSTRMYLFPWEWGQSEERPQQVLFYRDLDEIGNLEERRESEDLRVACLLCWLPCFSAWLGWKAPRECLLQLGDRMAG